jgi:hypothetical protein
MNPIEQECPICFDAIITEINKITTECGHCFHANCLMKNAAYNGFGCPYCRAVMAEAPSDEDDESISSSELTERGEDFSDVVLQGMRWLFQRVEDEEIDEDEEDLREPEEPPRQLPCVSFICSKLLEQGVTAEDLLKALLVSSEHPEYEDNPYFMGYESDIFDKCRVIIESYEPTTTTN